jgi:hypothetical protein
LVLALPRIVTVATTVEPSDFFIVTLTTQELSRSPRSTVFPETRHGSPKYDWTEPDNDLIPDIPIFADFITDDNERRVFPDAKFLETYFVFGVFVFELMVVDLFCEVVTERVGTTDADTKSPRP